MTATLQGPEELLTPSQDGPSVLVAADYAQGSRARRGERLDHVFEERVDWAQSYGPAGQLAVDAGDVTLTFAELDERANQLARYLLVGGARAGDRIALLFDQPVHSYVAMLAVLKINAAYVPLDVGFPADRIAYIVSDAGARFVLSLSHVRDRVEGLEEFAPGLLYVDRVAGAIARQNPARLTAAERGEPVEDLAYLIYTSGTTGKPKGVAIEHSSICNFVRVAAEVYGIRPKDRVYQGMTIAFDFSVEEIWVPWVAGATLVPKPAGSSLLGMDLHAFLTERKVTALCCVPTLLATIEEDLPALRFLLVSGEACPQDLIARWYQPGRRFLNVYGPTEATVTATWTTLHPDRPVTIGQPLPTYTTVILDPENPHRALPHGETGEIGIAGIGLATGYLNRDDLTDKAFIPDFLGIAGNPSGRIYRTGDLGRVNADGEIEYLGRIDLQVKIRGYRIELTEIESVLMQVPGIAAVAVDTFEPMPGTVELVGYYSLRTGVTPPAQDAITAHLREQLPPYMVPAYLEHLAAIPMTPQDKIDRKALPAPTARRAAGSAGEHIAAATDTERILAEALATTLGLDTVSVDSHFFDDLGANSLLMARFSALVRKETALPSLSMREVYGNPTIRQLAVAMGGATPMQGGPAPTGTVVRGSTAGYWMVGTLQLLAFLGVSYVSALLLTAGIAWSFAGATTLEVFERSAAFAVATFVAACVLPILAKWLLIGRFTPREIRLWSLGYFRFWVVKTLMRANPLVFLGGPVYNIYLRALGAKIGRGTTILSGTVPVATDLLTIGANTLIRRDSSFSGYRAVAGKIQIGRVQIGRDVFIGEKTALDIESSIGDGAQLGHTSSVHSGQHIPAGERWHGVPAEPTTVDYRVLPPARGGRLRRFGYGALQLLSALVVAPLLVATAAAVASLPAVEPVVQGVVADGHGMLLTPAFYGWVAVMTAALFVFAVLAGLMTMIIAPRLLSLFIRPGQTYPLFGVRWIIAQTITRLGNSEFFMTLFGDASAAVVYLTAIGYRMPELEQTGSNFGTELKQDSALLTTIGSGTMVSDSLSIMNADFSAGSFRMSEISIGAHCFIGNNIAYPADARIGENVLLGSKVMVPMDGPVRENVGLLGSPCFEIPRTVARDTEFDHLKDPAQLRLSMRRKNRHNATSMLLFLGVRWLQVYVSTLLLFAAADLYYLLGTLSIVAAMVATTVSTIFISVLVERMVMGFRGLQARFVSIYDPYFWRHERLWKLGYTNALFSGTPFKNVVWRMLGVRIGHRVFDDGCSIPEKTLVTIGDDVVLNAGSLIQCHSLEDGSFKSDATVLGAGTVIGVDTFVHYGVTMGEGSMLEADAFLMKGETVAPFSVWQGNPATEVRMVAPVAAQVVPAQVPAQVAPARVAPAQPARPVQPARPARAAVQTVAWLDAPVRTATPAPTRPVVTANHAFTPASAAAAAQRPAPRPAPAPASRPAPAPRPTPRSVPSPAPRPAPVARPALRPAPRPTVDSATVAVPAVRPAPRPAARHIDFVAGAGAVSPEQMDASLGNVVVRGEQIARRLAGLAHHPAVREVRGTGLMWGIEFNAPGDGRTAAALAADVRSRALHSGLIVELGGRDGSVLRMLPALDVTAEVVHIAVSILLHAIEGAYVGATEAA